MTDGVAPRAKMNQQRARRFRSAQEAKEKDAEKAEFFKLLRAQKAQKGEVIPEGAMEHLEKKTWDSNAITPGTPFMDILAASLRYWVAYKLNTDPLWYKMKVLISDATVPGEGEHKIMQFVRSQRSSPHHDPNTRHVIYGLDADLIMLGLATHEPHFRVLREDVFQQESKSQGCKICGQKGHRAEQCRGEARKQEGEFDEKNQLLQKPFIWLHVSILREYLAIEMHPPNTPFKFDLERALDDWVFMCFFVGNDFLPHLPSLEIREQGIDTLIQIWRTNLTKMGGYVTKDGYVDLTRAQVILSGLAQQEDQIFKRRKEDENRREANKKRRMTQEQRFNTNKVTKRFKQDSAPVQFQEDQMMSLESISAIGRWDKATPLQLQTPQKQAAGITYDQIVNGSGAASNDNGDGSNKSAAAVLKERLSQQAGNSPTSPQAAESSPAGNSDYTTTPPSALGKRKADVLDEEQGTPGRDSPLPHPNGDANGAPQPQKVDPDAPPPDTVRLWEDGYRDRYYEQKFHKDPSDIAFRHQVGRAYVEGLCWVLRYYMQGCPSWTWYYPYHYAPFAVDFVDVASMDIDFKQGQPFRPFEQLMGVLPAASNHAIPPIFHPLMTEPDSPIIDFYPEDFPLDLNGKKFLWQAVVILPFIDEQRLLKAMHEKYPLLTPNEQRRNERGRDVLLFSDHHPLYDAAATAFYSKKKKPDDDANLTLDPQASDCLAGEISKQPDFFPQRELTFPGDEDTMPNIPVDKSMMVHYAVPMSKNIHKSMLLRGANLPPPVLDQQDVETTADRALHSGRNNGGGYRGGRGRGGGPPRGGPSRGGYDSRNSNRSHDDRPNPFAGFFPNGAPQPPTSFQTTPQGAVAANGWPVPPPPPAWNGAFPPPPPQWKGPPPNFPGGFPPPPPGWQTQGNRGGRGGYGRGYGRY